MEPVGNQNIPSQPGSDKPSVSSSVPICAAIGMIGAFFLPWIQQSGYYSALNIAMEGTGYASLLWSIPTFAFIFLLSTWVPNRERIMAVIAGATPFLIWFFGIYRGNVWMTVAMGFGLYATLFCALLLLGHGICPVKLRKRVFANILASKNLTVLDHWYALIPNFQISSEEFYDLVEKAVQERKVPGLDSLRIELAEGGPLSAKRKYLRFARERFVFDVCCAPFGASTFFSSRFAEIPLTVHPMDVAILLFSIILGLKLFVGYLGLILGSIVLVLSLAIAIFTMRKAIALGLKNIDETLIKTPVISPIYQAYFRPDTYFREDLRLMYLQTVPEIVKMLVQEVTAAKGIKLLKQFESKGVLNGSYQPSITRLDQGGAKPLPMMVVSMTPFSNSPRDE